MGYAVRMPQLGMTMEEGVVVEWRVDDGEQFSANDVIAVIESEKTTNDIESREEGVIVERFVELDEPVEPGYPIAYVGEPGEDVPDDVRAELSNEGTEAVDVESVQADAETTDSTSAGEAVAIEQQTKVSPRARSYAAETEFDVDALANLEGSGPDGAVIEKDVIEAVDSNSFKQPAGGDARETSASLDVAGADEGRGIYDEADASQLRRSIARQMTVSAEQAPQVTLNRTVSVERLLELKARLAEERNLELSVTDFLLKAVARTLREHPKFNAIYEEDTHKLASNVNVGIAVDIDGGLVTPVLRHVDDLSLAEINAARSDLVEQVQNREYTGDDLADGTFTVTNLGHFGVESFDPLLNVPEVGILGVGTISHKPTGEGDTERCIALSLTFDHRPNDGADAAKFLDTLAGELEYPLRLLTLGRQGREREDSSAASGEAFVERNDGLEGARTAKAVSDGSMNATVRSRRFEWAADEPEERGGDDAAPTPVEQFLGSLSSCLALFVGTIADRRSVNIENVEVAVDAEPDHDAIERIDVEVTVVSDADESDIERVVQTAERACYVNRAVSEEVEGSLSITVERP